MKKIINWLKVHINMGHIWKKLLCDILFTDQNNLTLLELATLAHKIHLKGKRARNWNF